MRIPSPLPDGGTIGFVAPSFGCAPEPYCTAFLNALERFRARGYRNVSSKVYPNMRHEIHNETGKEAVWQDLAKTLDAWREK